MYCLSGFICSFLLMSFARFVPITKTRLFKYIENFYIENFTSKNCKFLDKKNSDIFHIFAQDIDCGYSLKPPTIYVFEQK